MNNYQQIEFLEEVGFSPKLLKYFDFEVLKKNVAIAEEYDDFWTQRAILTNPKLLKVPKDRSKWFLDRVFNKEFFDLKWVTPKVFKEVLALNCDAAKLCFRCGKEFTKKLLEFSDGFVRSIEPCHELRVQEIVASPEIKEYLERFRPSYSEMILWEERELEFVKRLDGLCHVKFVDREEEFAKAKEQIKAWEMCLEMLNSGLIQVDELKKISSAKNELEVFSQVFDFDFTPLEGMKLGVLAYLAQENAWVTLNQLKMLEGLTEESVLQEKVFWEKFGVFQDLAILEELKDREDFSVNGGFQITLEIIREWDNLSRKARECIELGATLDEVKECVLGFEEKISSCAFLIWNLSKMTIQDWMGKYDLEKSECIRVISYNYNWDKLSLKYYDFVVDNRISKPLLSGGICQYVHGYRNAAVTTLLKDEVEGLETEILLDCLNNEDFLWFAEKVRWSGEILKKVFLGRLKKFVVGERYLEQVRNRAVSVKKMANFLDRVKVLRAVEKSLEIKEDDLVTLFLNLLDDNKIVTRNSVFSIREMMDGSLGLLREFGNGKAPALEGIPVVDSDFVIGLTGAPYKVYGVAGELHVEY